MFGHQDDQLAQQGDSAVSDEPIHETPGSEAAGSTVAPADGTADPSADSTGSEPDADDSEEIIVKPDEDGQAQADAPQTDQQQDEADKSEAPAANEPWQHPGTPLDNAQEPINDVISPAGGFPKRTTFQYPAALADTGNVAEEQPSTDAPQVNNDDELIDVKKQALEELSPLIDKLDLPPEEKFRTIMMMIQASDDENLVKAAYEAAHSIEDEKVRAQALLDVVNEVNYFIQPPADQPTDQAS